MTQADVNNLLIQYHHLFKDEQGDSIIYNINGVERYISGYKLVDEIFTLYLAPTKSAIERGITLSDSIEWSDFLNKHGMS